VKQLAERSNAAVRECHDRGEHIKWVTSYIADDVVVCVYKASGEAVLRERPPFASFGYLVSWFALP
jgi:hypothetical protein